MQQELANLQSAIERGSDSDVRAALEKVLYMVDSLSPTAPGADILHSFLRVLTEASRIRREGPRWPG